jgi:PilY1 beta-propeller domain/Calx-beta domain
MKNIQKIYRFSSQLLLIAFMVIAFSSFANATVSIIATTPNAAEPGTNGEFTVTLSEGVLGADTIVTYNVAGSTATAGTDYTALSGNVTISAGNPSAVISVNILDNATIEGDETVAVTLTGANNGVTVVGAPGNNATVTIGDNDNATVSISATDATATESGDDGTFTVALTDLSSSDTVLSLTPSGTAVEGTDYNTLPATVTIPAGSLSEIITIIGSADAIVESDESVLLTIAINSGDPEISLGAASDTVTITDSDTANVSITATDATATEAGDTGMFTVALSQVSSTATEIALNAGGTAGEGTDYNNIPASVTIPAGSLNQTITMTAGSDNIIEAAETAIVSLSGIISGDPQISIVGASDTVTIANVDQAEFSITDVSQDENTGAMTFTVSSGKVVEGTSVSVQYDTSNGTAAAPGDYTAQVTQTATINAGSSTTFAVPVVSDTVVEGDEAFTVLLSNPSASATITDSSATATIINDDVPVISITGSDMAEGDVGTTATGVSLSSNLVIASDAVVSVAYAVTHGTTIASDFAGTTSGTLLMSNVGAGVAVPVALDIAADEVVEYDEDYTVSMNSGTIQSGSGAPDVSATASGVIRNDDSAVLMLTIASSSDAEGADGDNPSVPYTVESDLTIAAGVSVSFDYTVVGGGALPASGADMLEGTFASAITGGTTVDVPVILTGDDIVEGDETYTVVIGNPGQINSAVAPTITAVPGNDTANGTILNEDIPTLTINDSSVYESDAGTVDPAFTVTTDLAVAAGTTVSFNWDVQHGTTDAADFSGATSASLSFDGVVAGSSVAVPLLIQGDTDVEPNESYSVRMNTGAISNTAGTPTISDTGNGEILNDEFEITMISGAEGTITNGGFTAPPDTVVKVARNTTPSFTVTVADPCYHIESVVAEGTTNTSFTNLDQTFVYTFAPVVQNETIEATYTIDRWEVTSSIIGEAHGTITDSAVFDACTDPDYTVTADTDHHVTYVEVDGGYVDGPNAAPFTVSTFTHTFTNIQDDHTINAAFTQLLEVIEDSPFGSVVPDPEDDIYIEYAYDAVVNDFVVTAVAPCDTLPVGHTHHISDILVDGVPQGIRGTNEVGPYTFVYPTKITADSVLEIQFTGHVDVTVVGPGEVSLNGGQQVTGSGTIEFESDINQIFDIVAGVGYHIEEVKIDGSDVGRVSKYTFSEEVALDHTLEVKFAIDWYSVEATSTYETVFNNSAEDEVATTQYPLYGEDVSFFVDLNDPIHAIKAVFVDNIKIVLPPSGDSTTGDGFTVTNTDNDTLEIEFDNVSASHRVVVVDYDITPISDVPLVASSVRAPSNIMFIIDDSGSMSWSTMVPGIEQGKYCIGGTGIYCTGGSRYTSVLQSGGQIPTQHRMQWKSQWLEYNRMYYNPEVNYVPWPRVVEISQTVGDPRTDADADTYAPRFYPLSAGSVLILSNTFATIGTAATTIIVDDEDAGYSVSDSSHYRQNGSGSSYNGDYEYANGSAANKWASWSFTPPSDDEYEVYVSWRHNNSRRVVPYTVSCPTCVPAINDTINVDQSNDGLPDSTTGEPQFSLGTYSFESGKNITVTLADNYQESYTSSTDAVMITTGKVTIPNAHYYVWSTVEAAPYLVTFDANISAIRYYKAGGTSIDSDLNNSNDVVTTLEEKKGTDIPSDVKVDDSYSDALQNFANWVTYYRERRCAAISAVGRSLVKVDGIKVGLSSLRPTATNVTPVRPIKVGGEDYTDELLKDLYDWPATGGTPLHNALEETGQYFADTDSNGWSKDMESPFASEEDGGGCQQAFAILMTDGYYNSIQRDRTYNDDNSDSAPYGSVFGGTLADIAMYFYENDMYPDSYDSDSNPDTFARSNNVSPSPEQTETHDDPADWQHMITYTVSFGLVGTLDPDDYNLHMEDPSHHYPTWPQPVSDQPTTIDDLWHTAVNGRGLFLNASNPDELVSSLLKIINNVSDRDGSSASVSINGDELYETIGTDTRMYQTSYNSERWDGDLRSYELVIDTGGNWGVASVADWSASDTMDTEGHGNLFTYKTTNKQGVDFSNISNLSAVQRAALMPYFHLVDGPDAGTDWDYDETHVLSYLTGNDSLELPDPDGIFRERAKPFGDFVDSQPVFHRGVIYVGGNDGMLHAFDANADGKELFAYVPSLIYHDLRELANPDYNHKFYVNGTPFVEDIAKDSDGNPTLTLLVGGLGKGGKGIYALNVTNPNATAANIVEWEYPAPPDVLINGSTTITFSNPGSGYDLIKGGTNAFQYSSFDTGEYITVVGADCPGDSNNGTYEILSKNSNEEIAIEGGSLSNACGNGESIIITESTADPGMGYSFSEPILVRTYDSTINNGTDLEGWVVVFGNGYGSEDGTAQLYIVNPKDGELIKKIDTGVGPGNGLSSARMIDANSDLKVDYVYGGDLLGNMWKFELKGSAADWQVAYCDGGDNTVSDCNAIGGVTPQPLFKGNSNQAITGAPDVMYHKTYRGYLVTFGTGKFLGVPDLTNHNLQSIYGIWDWAPDIYDAGYLGERTDALEDIDGDGGLDVHEDLDNDGNIDVNEDVDGDGVLDVTDEDLNGDGNLDVNEDLNGDGGLNFDVDEDLNNNGIIDGVEIDIDGDGSADNVNEIDEDGDGIMDFVDEDVDGDGHLDIVEDIDGDGRLDLVDEDLDGDGHLDVDEDLNGNGLIDALTVATVTNSPVRDAFGNPMNTLLRQEVLIEGELTEDTDGDGHLDRDEDVNGNGILDAGEDLDGDGHLDVQEDQNQNGIIDTYSYYRIPSSYDPDWTMAFTVDTNGTGGISEADGDRPVPQADIGWYFDLQGIISDNDATDNDGDGEIDEVGERSLGERVVDDAMIRDGKVILVSFGITGSTCDVGMFSFLIERNARTGGSLAEPIFDINGDNVIDEDDMVLITGGGGGGKGIPTDRASKGRDYVPAILRDPRNPGSEVKLMSNSDGTITTVVERAEKRGIHYWQQVE